MSFSLYYEAKRVEKITKQEQAACQEIIERYCFEYDFEEKVEDFGVYEFEEETNIIFGGATKLPDSAPEIMFEAANYWLKCLTEITNTLPDCQWTVTFEEVELIFDENDGWRFPTDEEYQ